MILVLAHNAWRCSGAGKVGLVYVLLLCNKYIEMTSNSSVSRLWENANINVVDHIHGYTVVVR